MENLYYIKERRDNTDLIYTITDLVWRRYDSANRMDIFDATTENGELYDVPLINCEYLYITKEQATDWLAKRTKAVTEKTIALEYIKFSNDLTLKSIELFKEEVILTITNKCAQFEIVGSGVDIGDSEYYDLIDFLGSIEDIKWSIASSRYGSEANLTIRKQHGELIIKNYTITKK